MGGPARLFLEGGRGQKRETLLEQTTEIEKRMGEGN